MPLPHLWKEAFSDVKRWADHAHSHSLLLDFDGTLTPLMPDPNFVFLDGTVRRVLTEIQETGRFSIGIISGRSLEEIQSRIGIDGVVYAGNHGMEIVGPGFRFVDQMALAVREDLQLLALRFKSELKQLQNFQIRNKGLSITIHWNTPFLPDNHEEVRSVVIDAVADGSGRFTVRDAKNSLDIVPNTYWNKGSAAFWINNHIGIPSRNSMYVGDDCTDEDVFQTLPDAITVKVGPDLNTYARYVLKDSDEVLTLLKLLLILSRKR